MDQLIAWAVIGLSLVMLSCVGVIFLLSNRRNSDQPNAGNKVDQDFI